jgi:HAD superfamily hydrolase (TIGR01549 family)
MGSRRDEPHLKRHRRPLVPIFDLDGTLLDSDAALSAAFVSLGVAPDSITFGHVIGEECKRLGISLAAYVSAYDTSAAAPFPGVPELLGALGRWGLCSNKHRASGEAELTRLGWHPEVAFFTEDFAGPKRLEPVLAALEVAEQDAVFIGDTAHDRECASACGVCFVLAGWNAWTADIKADLVLEHPQSLLNILNPLSQM